MSLIRFAIPSLRSLLGFIAFIALTYGVGKSEHFIISLSIHFLRDHFHFSFRTVFAPKPAVPVNILTAIVLIRSASVFLIAWIALKIDGSSWSQTGFSRRGALSQYGYGLATGFVAISVLMGLLWVSGSLIFDGLRLNSDQICRADYAGCSAF